MKRSTICPEGKMPPKMQKCWIHCGFDVLKTVNAWSWWPDGHGRWAFNTCYANPYNIYSHRRTPTTTTKHAHKASSANATLILFILISVFCSLHSNSPWDDLSRLDSTSPKPSSPLGLSVMSPLERLGVKMFLVDQGGKFSPSQQFQCPSTTFTWLTILISRA